MEILVVRLDFSLAGCTESGCFSNSSLWHPTPPAHLRICRKPPGVRGVGQGVEGSDAPRATLACGIFSSLVYADFGDFTNAIELAAGPRGLRLRLTLQSLAAGSREPPDKWAGNQREDTIPPSISKYFSSIYWPSFRRKEKKTLLISRLELKVPKENSLHVICLKACRKLSKRVSRGVRGVKWSH